MKATLTFTLPEEHEEFTHAIHGQDYMLVLWDLDQWLRGRIKYHDEEHLQSARDELYRLAGERGVEII